MTIPASFVGGRTLFHEVMPQVGDAPTAAAVRADALQIHLPMRADIKGGDVPFWPERMPDAGQKPRAAAVGGQWQRVGQMNVIYPPAYATAAPRFPA